ncbi:MAG TPA: hypothetical protein VEX43_07295 [Chthoniobacterales bacterium]|nr:hypothetical protein [Chthoniobacterales bacterium]
MKIIVPVLVLLVIAFLVNHWLRSRQKEDFVFSDSSSPKSTIRDTLFGDTALERWMGDGQGIPWSHFAAGKRSLDDGNREQAASCFKQVLNVPNLEPRHYLQAWHFLRPLGHNPTPEESRKVLGVVVEIPIQDGLDLVAAYPDHTARYYNFSGAGVVWSHPDASLDQQIDQLICAGEAVAKQLSPWPGSRPKPPSTGQVRLSFLTPAGISFGQGPFQDLAADPNGGPVIAAAADLMQALMAKAQPKQ